MSLKVNIFIDGNSVFQYFLDEVWKDQLVLFSISYEQLPINNFILLFDTLVRVMLYWRKLKDSLTQIYDVNEFIFIKNKLIIKPKLRFDTKKKKYVNIETIKEEIIELMKYCHENRDRFIEEDRAEILSLMKELGHKYKYTFLDVHRSSEIVDPRTFNLHYMRLAYLLALDQTTLQSQQIEYLYNLFASQCFEKICESIQPQNMYQSVYITNKEIVNLKTYSNIEILKPNLEIINTIQDCYQLPIRYNLKFIKINERRSLPTVCTRSYFKILKFSEYNLPLVIGDWKKIYIDFDRPKAVEFCCLPTSLKTTYYSMYQAIFIKTLKMLRMTKLIKFMITR